MGCRSVVADHKWAVENRRVVEGKQGLEDIAAGGYKQPVEVDMLVEEGSLESSGAGHSSLYLFGIRQLDLGKQLWLQRQ